MAYIVDTGLMDRIRRYGAFDVSACFNCGNCTAVCPLSKEQTNFPRRLIRYGQVGMEDRLLADKDLWMCYYCGECSQTCPRQASPGEYMAAARRYAISRYDVTGLSRAMFRWPALMVIVFILVSGLMSLLLLWHKGDVNGQPLALFQFIPGQVIHDLGVGVFAVIGLAGLMGLTSMIWRFRTVQRTGGVHLALSWPVLAGAVTYAVTESLAQFRYRQCDSEGSPSPFRPRPWLVHAVMLWGFLGMLTATGLDFLFKPIGSSVSPWYPMRLLGALSGLVCLAGLSITIYRRYTKPTLGYAQTRLADGFFLGLLTATVVTGLATELVVYLPVPALLAYGLFLVHVVLAMDLIALLPVTKFAHAIYRPAALFLHRWAELSVAQPGVAAETAS